MAAKRKKTKRKAKPRGRPLAPLNLREVEKLAAMGCSSPQLAEFFEVDESTVQRRKRNDDAFKAAIARGQAKARVKLQSAQFDTAVNARNPTMLIWMGKQMLGQRDVTAMEHSAPGGGPIQLQNVPATRAKLTKLIERKLQEEGAAVGPVSGSSSSGL